MILIGALPRQRKRLVVTLVKQGVFAWVHIIMVTIVTCLLYKKEKIFNIKTDNINVNFSTQFCLGCISNGFHVTNCGEVSLGGNVYDSVNCNAVDNSEIWNIHMYLMVKNYINVWPLWTSFYWIIS